MRLLVINDVGLELVTSNKDSVQDGFTGVLHDKAGEFDYVSKHPLIVGWSMNGISIGEFNASTCAVIDLHFGKVMTQINYKHGAVINLVAVDGTADVTDYFPEHNSDLVDDDGDSVIRLSELLDSVPKLYVEKKKYTDRVTIRIGDDLVSYLKSVGDGSVSDGARMIIEWAELYRPELDSLGGKDHE